MSKDTEALNLYVMGGDDARLPALLKPFKKTPGLSWAIPPDSTWVFASKGGQVVGVVALALMPDGSVRFKSDVVLPEHRGKGVYAALSAKRLELAGEMGVSKATAFALPTSLPQFLKDGFKLQSRNAKGVSYVVKGL